MDNKIARLESALYRIPLPVALSDSTHGTMTHFELITARVFDDAGAEGMGYTYTVGCNGAAIHSQIQRDLAPVLIGQAADRIESLWQQMWWRLHYGGRGGSASFAISAVDIALWDLKARRQGEPLWRVLGGNDALVPCYAGGIDLQFPLERLLKQTEDNLARGFRAIKMKVGRPKLSEDLARVRAMREMLGEDFPLMVDANMRWGVDEAVRAARGTAGVERLLAGGADYSGRRRRSRAHRARGGGAGCRRGESPFTVGIHGVYPRAGGYLPRTRRDQLRRRHQLHEGRAPRGGLQSAGHFARRARHHGALSRGSA